MKVFVSTEETQGQRENDFCFVPEGEIVAYPVMTCTNESADGECGCCRSMSGVLSQKATTTMKVAEVEGNVFVLERILRASFKDAGWTVTDSQVCVTAAKLLRDARQFPAGAIVEYRDCEFLVRNA